MKYIISIIIFFLSFNCFAFELDEKFLEKNASKVRKDNSGVCSFVLKEKAKMGKLEFSPGTTIFTFGCDIKDSIVNRIEFHHPIQINENLSIIRYLQKFEFYKGNYSTSQNNYFSYLDKDTVSKNIKYSSGPIVFNKDSEIKLGTLKEDTKIGKFTFKANTQINFRKGQAPLEKSDEGEFFSEYPYGTLSINTTYNGAEIQKGKRIFFWDNELKKPRIAVVSIDLKLKNGEIIKAGDTAKFLKDSGEVTNVLFNEDCSRIAKKTFNRGDIFKKDHDCYNSAYNQRKIKRADRTNKRKLTN